MPQNGFPNQDGVTRILAVVFINGSLNQTWGAWGSISSASCTPSAAAIHQPKTLTDVVLCRSKSMAQITPRHSSNVRVFTEGRHQSLKKSLQKAVDAMEWTLDKVCATMQSRNHCKEWAEVTILYMGQ
jgi:hypothetical protein